MFQPFNFFDNVWHVLGWRESIHAKNTLFIIYFIMLSSLSIFREILLQI